MQREGDELVCTRKETLIRGRSVSSHPLERRDIAVGARGARMSIIKVWRVVVLGGRRRASDRVLVSIPPRSRVRVLVVSPARVVRVDLSGSISDRTCLEGSLRVVHGRSLKPLLPLDLGGVAVRDAETDLRGRDVVRVVVGMRACLLSSGSDGALLQDLGSLSPLDDGESGGSSRCRGQDAFDTACEMSREDSPLDGRTGSENGSLLLGTLESKFLSRQRKKRGQFCVSS